MRGRRRKRKKRRGDLAAIDAPARIKLGESRKGREKWERRGITGIIPLLSLGRGSGFGRGPLKPRRLKRGGLDDRWAQSGGGGPAAPVLW